MFAQTAAAPTAVKPAKAAARAGAVKAIKSAATAKKASAAKRTVAAKRAAHIDALKKATLRTLAPKSAPPRLEVLSRRAVDSPGHYPFGVILISLPSSSSVTT